MRKIFTILLFCFTILTQNGWTRTDNHSLIVNANNEAASEGFAARFFASFQAQLKSEFTAMGMLLTNGTVSSRVNTGVDDAEETLSSGAVSLNSSDLELINDGGSLVQIVGLRFNSMNIPQGATITNAYIEFEVDEVDSGTTNLIFSGQDIDNAPTFTSTSYNISSRTPTSNEVLWNNVAAWNTVNEKKQTPNLSAIIQEIVDRSGWVRGNSLVIMVEGSGERTAEAYEGENVNAPLLVVNYSTATFACSGGLFTNPDFEAGAGSWNLEPNTSISTSEAYDGTQSAYANTTGIGGPAQNVIGTPGEIYTLEVYAKKTTAAESVVGIKYYDGSWNFLEASYLDVTSSTWEPYYISIKAPANTVYVQALGWKNTTAGGAWWDGFCLQNWSITEATTANPYCEVSPSFDNYIWSMDDSGSNSSWMDYDRADMILIDNGDGTLRMKGNIINGKDSEWHISDGQACGSKDGWAVDLTLFDRQTWDEFQGSYAVDGACPNAYLDLDYWDMTGTLTGLGCNTGRTITVANPSVGYRMQIGTGGNSQNCGFGMSTWFNGDENGTVIHGDIYANLDEACYLALRPQDCNNANVINNNEFDNGTSDWFLYQQSGSTAAFSINNTSQLSGANSAFIDIITTQSGTNWHIQLAQVNHSIEAGKTYKIGFKAKATAPKNIYLAAQRQISPYNQYWSQTIPLTTTATDYAYEFTADSTVTDLVSLVYSLGETTDNVYLDSIYFREVCPDEVCSTTGTADVFYEAECAQVGANFTTVADAGASGDEYVQFQGTSEFTNPAAIADDYIRFNVAVDAAGVYKVFLRTKATTTNDDSFWVRANEGDWIKFNNIPISAGWTWNQVHDADNGNALVTFCLEEGLNTLDISRREHNAVVDKIYITGTGSAPVNEGGVSANCPQEFICDSKFYQTIEISDKFWLYEVQTSPNVILTPLVNMTDAGVQGDVNPSVFNLQDNYIYVLNNSSPFRLYRIGGDYSIHYLGNVSGFPLNAAVNAGVIHKDGTIIYRNTLEEQLYELDFSTMSVSLLCDFPNNASPQHNIGDLAFNPANGKYYGTRDSSNILVSLDVNTCTENTITLSREIEGANGAFYISADGTGYGYENNTGKLTKINLTTGLVEDIGQDVSTANVDGCSCEGVKFNKELAVQYETLGDTATYIFTIYNNWKEPLTNISFKDTLTDGLTWGSEPWNVSGLTLGATSVTGNTIADFTLTNVPIGISTFSLTANVPANYTGPKPYENTAYLKQIPNQLGGYRPSGDPTTPEIDDPTKMYFSSISLSTPVVSACIDQPLRDVTTISIDVSWANAPANDMIEVTVGDKIERIDVAGGATSPQTVIFIVEADGSTGNTISANWRNNPATPVNVTYDAPAACSSDAIACDILYLCGLEKPYDGDPWDHGWIEYLDEMNGAATVTPILTKADGSGMGTYNPNNPTTFVNVTLTDYDLIVVSATTENHIANDLVNALKNVSAGLINANFTIINDLGMSTVEGGYTWGTAAYTNDITNVEIYNYDNINPWYSYVFTRGDYTADADAFLWAYAGDQSVRQNGYMFAYSAADALPGISAGHGTRVYLGYHMNGLYANPVNNGAIPAPVSTWFSPEKHLTLTGKSIFDQAIVLAAAGCGNTAEICDNGIDDDGDGNVDCLDSNCGVPTISNVNAENPTLSSCPNLNNGTVTITSSGSNLQYSINGGTTFQASNSFTGLTSGTYQIVVENSVSGCRDTDVATLTAPTCVEICNNSIDDDGDGFIDNADSDCCNNVTNAGSITGNESNCGSFNPTEITEVSPASGGSNVLLYQWESSLNNLVWTEINGATNASYDPTSIAQTTYFQRKAKRLGCTNATWLTSNVVTKEVVTSYTNGGTISGDESNCGNYDPTAMTSTTVPSGGAGGSVAYQWQSSPNGVDSWIDISGATAANYDPTSISATTFYRRNARRATCDTYVYSNVIEKEVVFSFTDGGTISGDESECGSYNPAVISSSAIPSGGSGGTLTYQWQYDNGAGWTDIAGANSVTYDPTTISQTTQYRRAARRYTCDPYIYSNVVNKEIVTALTNTGSIDGDESNCGSYDPSTITEVSPATGGQGGSIKYQWQQSTDGTTWTGIPGATNSTYNPETINQTTHFQRGARRSNCQGYLYSNVVVKSVINNYTDGGTIAGDEDFCPPYNASPISNGVAPTGSSDAIEYQWESSTESLNWTVISGENTATYTHGTITETTYFRRSARAVHCTAWQLSNIITKSIEPITITDGGTIDGAEKYCGSFNPTAMTNSVLPNNHGGNTITYEWEQSTDFGYSWTIITGAFGETYDPGNITITTRYRRKSKLYACDSWQMSNEIIKKVVGQPTANDDSFDSCPGVIFSNNVRVNDEAVDNPSYTIAQNPTAGTVTIDNTGKFTYTPSGVNCAIDQFSYQVCNDETTCCDIAVVTINLADSTPPNLINVPADITLECDATIPELPLVLAIDNCPAISINTHEVSTRTATGCGRFSYTITRTWIAADFCGNATSATQLITVQDTVPPTFTPPSSANLACTADKDDLSLTGDVTDELDNCSTNLQATYTDDLSSLNLTACRGFMVRTWSVTDVCGNFSTALQNIYIFDDTDRDKDGTPDGNDLDDDNDGIPDVDETDADTDGDGIINRLDLDSDNDGIPDILEAGFVDSNGDGVVDNLGLPGWDDDHDGFADGFDANDLDTSLVASDNFEPLAPSRDRDGDSVTNFWDLDSDNDGIGDLIETGGVDTNGDGIIDYPTISDPTSMMDIDNDGFADIYDPDNDGNPGVESAFQPLMVYNGIEYVDGTTNKNLDEDGDDIPNLYDLDSDNDSISDLIEAEGVDTDGDGKIDLVGEFEDANGDGFHDNYSVLSVVTTDPDGAIIDGRPEDDDGDGTPFNGCDLDQDGIRNQLDLDSDGDGILDIVEIGNSSADANHDGRLDSTMDSNKDGFDDNLVVMGFITTDGDGAIDDGRPEDDGDTNASPYNTSSIDGSMAEANGETDIDDDGDAKLNFLDLDSDGDLIPDVVEDANQNGIQDPGETGAYDSDSDNDMIRDGTEDTNVNGMFEVGETDPLNPNTDGDPLDDGVEDANQNGTVDFSESDPRDPCDPFLNASCIGVAVDLKIRLQGALMGVTSDTLMRDDLRTTGVLPLQEPYSELPGFVHRGLGGGEVIDTSLLTISGPNAIVDWVLIELRDATVPGIIVATRSVLLQRDGDIVDTSGLAPVRFPNVSSGSYYISVRHRNHLGIMTYHTHILSPQAKTIDFRTPNTLTYGGENAQLKKSGRMHLWAGDINSDHKVIYQGPQNDILNMFLTVLVDEGNINYYANYIRTGYDGSDINLDGKTIYQGPGNDRGKLLIDIILNHSGNVGHLSNFVIWEKMPQ